jgi:hypothetical protein
MFTFSRTARSDPQAPLLTGTYFAGRATVLVSRRPRFIIAAFALSLGACGRGDYLGAAVTGGLGVAGAGVHRATTKGCWGQCMNGLVCDHASGMCVEHPRCNGKCARDERCEEGTVARCVPIGELPSTNAPESREGGALEGSALESDAGSFDRTPDASRPDTPR